MRINQNRLVLWIAVLLAALITAGCGGGGGDSSAPPPVTLSSITITPGSATIAKGLTASLTATGTYSDNSTSNITSDVTWSSADPTIADVANTTGIVSANAIGSTSIAASLNNVTSPAASITVTAAALTGISISPGTASIAKGNTISFTATGTYTDGSSGNISGTVNWTSSDTTVATLNTSGIATGKAMGNSNITASLSGKTSNAASLTVTAPVVTSIEVTPSAPSVMVGSSINFTATSIYSDASTVDITSTASWASSDTSIATIGLNTGVAAGVAVGNVGITAAAGGLTSPLVTLTVTAFVPPVCSWDVTTWNYCLWGN